MASMASTGSDYGKVKFGGRPMTNLGEGADVWVNAQTKLGLIPDDGVPDLFGRHPHDDVVLID